MFHLLFSDARRKRPPPPRPPLRRRPGKVDENEYPGSADVSQEEISPENAKQSIIAALTDQEDELEEYDIHSKQAIKRN